jgi:hypothetical protein
MLNSSYELCSQPGIQENFLPIYYVCCHSTFNLADKKTPAAVSRTFLYRVTEYQLYYCYLISQPGLKADILRAFSSRMLGSSGICMLHVNAMNDMHTAALHETWVGYRIHSADVLMTDARHIRYKGL